MRAYFGGGLSGAEAARRFGYTPGSFRVLGHRSRRAPDRASFSPQAEGPHADPMADPLRHRIVEPRTQNLSIYGISRGPRDRGRPLGPAAVPRVLKAEGFARLPRRADDGRPPGPRPTAADVADVRRLDLTPRQMPTRLGGLLLVLPTPAALPLDRIARRAGLPGSRTIPAGRALRPLRALKLFGTARHPRPHEPRARRGPALVAGLKAIPKRSFLTEYSCRIDPACYPKRMRRWSDARTGLGLEPGGPFDLDFHAIPDHGDHAPVEKHDVSGRSRRQNRGLAFPARDADARLLLRQRRAAQGRTERRGPPLRPVPEAPTGHDPDELICDSKPTTYARLDAPNHPGINLIGLRRRSAEVMDEGHRTPPSAWRRIAPEGVSRTYKHPRSLDRRIALPEGRRRPPAAV